MSEQYDVIILGAGANGLICANYLAKAGGRVAIVEKNLETGGGFATEDAAGYKFVHHAIYMMVAELMPAYHDLNLKDRGVAFIRPEAQQAFLLDGKKSFVLYSDVEKSKRSIARLSPKDAETYGRMYREFNEMCLSFLIPAAYVPAVEPLEQMILLNQGGDMGRRVAEFSEMTPREVIADYKFEHPGVEAGLLYLSSMYDLDPEAGGMGFMVPLFVSRLTNAALVRAGSHQFSSALRWEFEGNGGEVITSAEVAEPLWDDSAVAGIKLANGRELRARAVVSTLNPQQTFLQFCGRQHIPEDLAITADDWQWDDWSLFIANWGVVGEPPRYEGYDAEVNQALSVVMGFNKPEDVLDHVEELRRGELPAEVRGHGTCLSLFDRLSIPYHMPPPFSPNATLRWECWAPYDLNWGEEKEKYSRKCFETWTRYAPNLSEASVVSSISLSPKDIERRLKNMARGSIKTGAYITLQMGFNRPSPTCSGYRTPIKGLYMAGASTHPGGMIVLGNGYNAARVLCEDLRLNVWWSVPEMVQKARDAGYIP